MYLQAKLKAIIDGMEVSTVVASTPMLATKGLSVHRLAARSVIQDWEHGSLSSDPSHHAVCIPLAWITGKIMKLN